MTLLTFSFLCTVAIITIKLVIKDTTSRTYPQFPLAAGLSISDSPDEVRVVRYIRNRDACLHCMDYELG